MKQYEIIMSRPGEGRIAIVKCKSEYTRQDDVIKALSNAISDWGNKTEEGKAEWRMSSGDFNIGDLSMVVGSHPSQAFSTLVPFLDKAGIYNLFVDTYGSDDICGYPYDSVLMSEPDSPDN